MPRSRPWLEQPFTGAGVRLSRLRALPARPNAGLAILFDIKQLERHTFRSMLAGGKRTGPLYTVESPQRALVATVAYVEIHHHAPAGFPQRSSAL